MSGPKPYRHEDCPDWELIFSPWHPDAKGGGQQAGAGSLYFRWHLEGQEPGPWLRWHGMQIRLTATLSCIEPPGKAEALSEPEAKP